MMDETTVRALGFILACHARVLGMHAANQVRESKGEAHAYDQQAFFAEASSMENIAHTLP